MENAFPVEGGDPRFNYRDDAAAKKGKGWFRAMHRSEISHEKKPLREVSPALQSGRVTRFFFQEWGKSCRPITGL